VKVSAQVLVALAQPGSPDLLEEQVSGRQKLLWAEAGLCWVLVWG